MQGRTRTCRSVLPRAWRPNSQLHLASAPQQGGAALLEHVLVVSSIGTFARSSVRARLTGRGCRTPFGRWRCCVCTVLTSRHRSARLHVCAMRRDVRLEQRLSSIRARCGSERAFFEHASVRAPSRCTLARLQHPHHERRVHHNRKLAQIRCENTTGDTADWLHRLGMVSQPNTCRESQSRRWATHAAPAVQKSIGIYDGLWHLSAFILSLHCTVS